MYRNKAITLVLIMLVVLGGFFLRFKFCKCGFARNCERSFTSAEW